MDVDETRTDCAWLPTATAIGVGTESRPENPPFSSGSRLSIG